jgi:hypothetical protein
VDLGSAKGNPEFHLYRRADDPLLRVREEERQWQRRPRPKPHPQHNGTSGSCPPADLETKARRYAAHLSVKGRRELGEALGVPEAALASLPLLGFSSDDRHGPCWTFPEVDATGKLIGLTRRYRDGSKMAMPGGGRGLTVPDGWRKRHGSIYLPEGASDTLTLTALGLPAVGRPSNAGGVDQLAELLRDWPADRDVIVLAEMDPKQSGDWPGRDGAVRTAQKLAELLGRPVCWALPPGKLKDVRAWVSAQHPNPTLSDSWSLLGERFAAELRLRYLEVAAGETGGRDTSPVTGSDSDQIHLTDCGNAIRLAQRHGPDLRHCFPWRKWLGWDGTRWSPDASGETARRAKEMVASLFRWAIQQMEKIRKQPERDGDDEPEQGGTEDTPGEAPQADELVPEE